MFNNLTNFLNLIANRKIKTSATIAGSDLIPLGTKDPNFVGGYQPTAIEFSELTKGIVTLESLMMLFSPNGYFMSSKRQYTMIGAGWKSAGGWTGYISNANDDYTEIIVTKTNLTDPKISLMPFAVHGLIQE